MTTLYSVSHSHLDYFASRPLFGISLSPIEVRVAYSCYSLSCGFLVIFCNVYLVIFCNVFLALFVFTLCLMNTEYQGAISQWRWKVCCTVFALHRMIIHVFGRFFSSSRKINLKVKLKNSFRLFIYLLCFVCYFMCVCVLFYFCKVRCSVYSVNTVKP